jgi:hypothetical protein
VPPTDRLLYRSDPLRTPFKSSALGSRKGARLSGQCHLTIDPCKQLLAITEPDIDVTTGGECNGSR